MSSMHVLKRGSPQLSRTKQTGLRTWGAGDFHFSTVFFLNKSLYPDSSGDWTWRAMSVKTLPCQTVLKSRSGTVHPALGLSLANPPWFVSFICALFHQLFFRYLFTHFLISWVKLNKDFSRCAVSLLWALRCLEMRIVLCWQSYWNEP